MQVRKFADELRFFDTLFLATDFKFLDGLHPSKGFDRLKISTKGISVVKKPVLTDEKTKQLQDVLKRKAATGSKKNEKKNEKKTIYPRKTICNRCFGCMDGNCAAHAQIIQKETEARKKEAEEVERIVADR
jgi:hypothetical protein